MMNVASHSIVGRPKTITLKQRPAVASRPGTRQYMTASFVSQAAFPYTEIALRAAVAPNEATDLMTISLDIVRSNESLIHSFPPLPTNTTIREFDALFTTLRFNFCETRVVLTYNLQMPEDRAGYIYDADVIFDLADVKPLAPLVLHHRSWERADQMVQCRADAWFHTVTLKGNLAGSPMIIDHTWDHRSIRQRHHRNKFVQLLGQAVFDDVNEFIETYTQVGQSLDV
ncbi:MAG: hypothetical protein JWM11_375 [Planctomycetaceae bacterium]|nr:hypothetical protein [Planctomycetaceae bacterium]